MTALQLNADIYRSLGVIAQDETALTKVSKYLRRVAQNISDYPGAELGNTAATYGTWEAVPATLREQIDATEKRSFVTARKGCSVILTAYDVRY